MSGGGAATSAPAGRAVVPAFVGRERSLAAVVEALDRRPALVLIEGDAGIGKTRLLREALAQAAGHRRAKGGDETPGLGGVLMTICPPHGEPLTLGPVVDAVRLACDRVAGLPLSPLAGALRPLYPEWAADLPPAVEPLDDAKAARHRLFRALVELIGCLGVSVLVVEDVHWADDATVEFLLYLASRQGAYGLSLTVTYRPQDLPADSPLRRLASRSPPAGTAQVCVALRPLGVADTAALVSSMLDGEPVSATFAAFLQERTGGVPLAVEESVRLMRDRADLVYHGGEWIRRSLAELEVPPTVREVVLQRLQRLTPATRQVLRAAAVLAEPSRESMLGAVSGLASDRVEAGLGEALAAGLLTERARGRVAVHHALMRQAVYEAIPAPERRRLHLRAGQALESVAPPPVAQLAHHFRQTGDDDSWAKYAEQAAEMALTSGDHDTASVVLHDLLDVTGPSLPAQVRSRLAIMLGSAVSYRRQEMDERHDRIVHTLRTVLDTGGMSPRERAKIRVSLSRHMRKSGEYEAAMAEVELAIPDLGNAPLDRARAMMFLALPVGGSWPLAKHLTWLRRAGQVDVTQARSVDRLALAAGRAAVLLCLGRPEGWAAAAEVPATGPSREERREIIRARVNFGAMALMWGRYQEARQQLAAAGDLADADGFEYERRRVHSTLIELDWNTGAWDGIAGRLGSSVEDDSDPIRSAARLVAGLLATVCGDRRAAEGHLAVGAELAARQGQAHAVADVAGALAQLRLSEGRVEEAIRLTAEPFQLIARKRGWIWATDLMPVRIEALVAAGRIEEASRSVKMFANGLRRRNVPAPAAALAQCRAILIEASGNHARAAAAFARATELWGRLPRPYSALLNSERQAQCLLAAGHNERALAVLSDVFHGCAKIGALGDADRIADKLRRHGIGVARPWRGRPGYGNRLSPRELEIVRLVAAGSTNAQIARTLSKSQPTVSTQLQSAMRKLGVSSRTALAVKAIAEGLVPGEGVDAGAQALAISGRNLFS